MDIWYMRLGFPGNLGRHVIEFYAEHVHGIS